MKDNYLFPAVFTVEENGISIRFPDLPGCLPCADDMGEAFQNAREALRLHLFGMEEDGEEIPNPSEITEIFTNPGEALVMIEVWMPPFREKMLNKAINKTVTLPQWLDVLAKRENINYSHFLQQALKNYLGVSGAQKLQGI